MSEHFVQLNKIQIKHTHIVTHKHVNSQFQEKTGGCVPCCYNRDTEWNTVPRLTL